MDKVILSEHALQRWVERIDKWFSLDDIEHALANAYHLPDKRVRKMIKKPPEDGYLYLRYKRIVMVLCEKGPGWYVLLTVWKVDRRGRFKHQDRDEPASVQLAN